MKRILTIAILLSYSIASFGVNLNYFYCCGKLKNVSLTVNTVVKNGKAKTSKGCCENKTVTIKLKTDQKSSDGSTLHFAAPLSPVIHYPDSFRVLNFANYGNINPLYKRPPPDFLPSRQVLYCVFRI